MNPSDHDLDSPVRHIVKELPVMRNQHKRSLIIFQVTFKPFDRLYVKVVGRLVKKKHVRS